MEKKFLFTLLFLCLLLGVGMGYSLSTSTIGNLILRGIMTVNGTAEFNSTVTFNSPAATCPTGAITQVRGTSTTCDDTLTLGETAITVDSITNDGLYISSVADANATDSLIRVETTNAGYDRPLCEYVQAGTGTSISVDQNGNTGTVGAVDIENTGNVNYGFRIRSANANPSSPLVYLFATDSGFDEPVLLLKTNGTGSALTVNGTVNINTVALNINGTAGYSGECADGTALTVVQGIITGCS